MAVRLVVFSLAGARYALPVERVREVVAWQTPRALGEPEPWLLGVVSLRGELLRVADLALRLGLAAGAPRRIVVFDAPDGPAGVAVDEVETVAEVEDAAVSPAPAGAGELVAGIATVGGDLVVVLDADALLGPKPPPRRRRATSPARKPRATRARGRKPPSR